MPIETAATDLPNGETFKIVTYDAISGRQQRSWEDQSRSTTRRSIREWLAAGYEVRVMSHQSRWSRMYYPDVERKAN